MSKATVFTKLKAPPHINTTTRPSHCSFNGNCIIVNAERNLRMYDLDKQMITKQWKPSNASIAGDYWEIKASCMDSKRNILYVVIGDRDFFGYLDDALLIAVDLTENEWNILKSNNITECQSIFFVTSINKLYINKPKTKQIDNLMSTRGDQYFYRNSTNQIFKKTRRELMLCDVNINDKSMSDWKIYEKELPNLDRFCPKFETILAFDQILFYFECSLSWHHNTWTIWCLDLDHNERWYRARYGMPNFGDANAVPYVIKDDYNNVHLINFGSQKRNRYHFRASLVDLISVEIAELNRKRSYLLIVGFVKEFEKRHKMTFLPMYLKKLIVQFYPIFV